ncbi:hypothetical protein EQM14_09255 [Caproiciproducens sp. NJN-50]|uniref:hypothetical protein n=1 Tax=Acutalibacteraceae TaxID=3082771 RepID=UPI000FFE077C|nr:MULTISPECIES: hypothetical protein [Acutalibacteraceae]QAT49945.1 hypothetical protein EQM14_09255 [Caproiciproducens sp. NJN-50]
MNYIKQIIKVIFITFLLATVVMLAFIFIISAKGEVDAPALGNLFGEFYLIILCAAVLAIIVAIPMGVTIYVKKNGVKKFIKITACAFAAGTIFSVAVSLIKYRTIISMEVIYLPIFCILILPIASLFGEKK